MVNNDQGVDTGLIRDVLLNQEAYKEFLVHAYESAWEDGVITEAEMKELKSFQEALGISRRSCADLNVKAAIKSAAADGEITDDEAKSIETAAKAANMTEEDTAKAVSDENSKSPMTTIRSTDGPRNQRTPPVLLPSISLHFHPSRKQPEFKPAQHYTAAIRDQPVRVLRPMLEEVPTASKTG